MNALLTYKPLNDESNFDVFFENGVKLGSILCEVTGDYVFYPELNGGYWEGYILRLLSDKLETLNKYEP